MSLYNRPPGHYLGYVKPGKVPVILLPGLFLRWGALKRIADRISLEGHPVYVAPELGHNLYRVATTARKVRRLMIKNNLKNVVVIGHSKGGLAGKYLLIHSNKDERVRSVISIATPFSGSIFGPLWMHKTGFELWPRSRLIRDMLANTAVNSKIFSIIPTFNNWLGSKFGGILSGAQNIHVRARGHHRVLFNKEVGEEIIGLLRGMDGGAARA